MTADQFNQYQRDLAPSRLQFCKRLGISARSGDAYSLGRAPIPLTVALAIAALQAGLQPAGEGPSQGEKKIPA